MNGRFALLAAASLLAVSGLAGCAAQRPAAPNEAADEPDRKAILAMVQSFHDGIVQHDRTRLRALFTSDAAALVGVNPSRAMTMTAGKFIDDVGSPANVFEETFSDVKITLYDGVATMDAAYTFQDHSKMTNQGRELWSVVKGERGWRIASVVWSIRPPASASR